jgi:hypothetical protein
MDSGSTLPRRQLGRYLRRLREGPGLTKIACMGRCGGGWV